MVYSTVGNPYSNCVHCSRSAPIYIGVWGSKGNVASPESPPAAVSGGGIVGCLQLAQVPSFSPWWPVNFNLCRTTCDQQLFTKQNICTSHINKFIQIYTVYIDLDLQLFNQHKSVNNSSHACDSQDQKHNINNIIILWRWENCMSAIKNTDRKTWNQQLIR